MTKILLAAILAIGTATMASAAPFEMTANELDKVTAGQRVTVNLTVTGGLPLDIRLAVAAAAAAP